MINIHVISTSLSLWLIFPVFIVFGPAVSCFNSHSWWPALCVCVQIVNFCSSDTHLGDSLKPVFSMFLGENLHLPLCPRVVLPCLTTFSRFWGDALSVISILVSNLCEYRSVGRILQGDIFSYFRSTQSQGTCPCHLHLPDGVFPLLHPLPSNLPAVWVLQLISLPSLLLECPLRYWFISLALSFLGISSL